MAIHRGAYIKNLIKDSEYSITEIANLVGVGRNTIYRWMNDETLPLPKMLRIAQKLGVDISFDFPKIEKLKNEQTKQLLQNESEDDNLSIKTKYMLLLERHAELLEEVSALKEEIAVYKQSKKKTP